MTPRLICVSMIVVLLFAFTRCGKTIDASPATAFKKASDSSLRFGQRLDAAWFLNQEEIVRLEERLLAELASGWNSGTIATIRLLGEIGDERALRSLDSITHAQNVAKQVRSSARWAIARIRNRKASIDAAGDANLDVDERFAAFINLNGNDQGVLESRLLAEIRDDNNTASAIALLESIGRCDTADALVQIQRSRAFGSVNSTIIHHAIERLRNLSPPLAVTRDSSRSVFERIAAARTLDNKQKECARNDLARYQLPGNWDTWTLDAIQVLGEIGDVDTVKKLESIDKCDELPRSIAPVLHAAIGNSIARIGERTTKPK
jgi:hypothetical protein